MSSTDQRDRSVPPRRIPADVDQPDRVLAGLTARQLGVLAGPAVLLILGWPLARAWLPATGYVALAAPIMIIALVIALLPHRDGTSLDTHLLAGLAYWLRPRQLTPSRQHLPRRRPASADSVWDPTDDYSPLGAGVPDWLAHRAVPITPDSGYGTDSSRDVGFRAGRAGTLRLPVRRVTDAASGEVGVLDLGGDGMAVLAAVTPVPFTWAAPADQQIVLDGFARLLYTVDLPIQILIRTICLDLRPALAELTHAVAQLPHPALVEAAAHHHNYLADLHAREDLLIRQVILVLRDPSAHRAPHVRDAAARTVRRLVRSLDDAHAALGNAGIELVALTAAEAETVLAASTHPDRLPPPPTFDTAPHPPPDIPQDAPPSAVADYRAGGGHRG